MPSRANPAAAVGLQPVLARWLPDFQGRTPKSGEKPGFANALPGTRRAPGHQLTFPGERMAHDGIEIVELWPTVERCPNAAHVGHQRGRIAGAAPGRLDRKIVAAHTANCIDDFENRGAAAIAAIKGHAVA